MNKPALILGIIHGLLRKKNPEKPSCERLNLSPLLLDRRAEEENSRFERYYMALLFWATGKYRQVLTSEQVVFLLYQFYAQLKGEEKREHENEPWTFEGLKQLLQEYVASQNLKDTIK